MRKNKRGASLVLVLMLMAFVMIVGLGVVAVAGFSSSQTSVNLTQRQADLTAQSVLNAVVAKIQDKTIDPVAAATNSNQIQGSDPKLGGWSYQISDANNIGVNCYKISVDAYYPLTNGVHSMMNRIIQGTLVQTAPSFTTIAQSTGGPDTIGNAILSGTIFADETNNSPQQLILDSGGKSSNGNIYVKGNLILQNSYQVTGSVYTKANTNASGDILLQGAANVTGSIYAAGNVTVQNGAAVYGSIYAKGKITVNYCTVTGSQNQYYAVPDYTAPTITTWPIPTNITTTQNAVFGTSDVKVTQNCILTISYSGGDNNNKNLIFDTTVNKQDLYIMLATPAMNTKYVDLLNNTNILVNGTNNVYIFLDDGANYVNFRVPYGMSYVGNAGYANGSIPSSNFETPHIYFISNKQSSVEFLGGNVTLYGYIYAPNGSVNMSGNGRFSSYMLYGGATAKKISFGSNENFYYLNNSQSGGSGGTLNWTGTNCKILGTYVGY